MDVFKNFNSYQIGGLLFERDEYRVFSARQVHEDFRREVMVCIWAPTPELIRSESRPQFDQWFQPEHPQITQLLNAGTTPSGQAFRVYELTSGEPITQYMHRVNLPVAQRLSLLQRVCETLHFAHQHLSIHGRLSAENIQVLEDGTFKITGFFQRITADCIDSSNQSPVSADIRATGLLLQEALQGVALPKELQETMNAALKPGGYGTILELAKDLDCYIRGFPVSAYSDRSLYRFRKFIVRHRYSALTASMVVISLLILSAQLLIQNQRLNQALKTAIREDTAARETIHLLVDAFESSDPEIARGDPLWPTEILQNAQQKLNVSFPIESKTHQRMSELIESLKKVHPPEPHDSP